MGRLAFLAARSIASAIFLLAWAYGVITHSSFALEQMVKPRLFPFLADFVTWHHLWFALAYALATATLIPVIRGHGSGWAARAAAVGFVAVFGGLSVWLLGQPYLASLNGARDLWVVPGALAPLLWLAVVDHLASAPRAFASGSEASEQRVLLFAAVGSAVVLWLAHGAAWLASGTSGDLPRAVIAAWTLALDVGGAALVYGALAFAAAVAARRRRPAAWEYAITVALLAAAFTELARRVILPTLAFTPRDCALIALPFGVVAALSWSGLRLHNQRQHGREGIVMLLAIHAGPPAWTIAAIAAVTLAGAAAFRQVSYFDWASVPQQLVAVIEAAIVFGLWLPAARRWTADRRWSIAAWLAPPAIAVLVLHTIAPLTTAAAVRLTGRAVDAQSLVDHSISADPLARLASAALVAREPFDVEFYRRVHAAESAAWSLSPAVSAAARPEAVTAASRPPHVFILAIDSLRRDYVSIYNPAVTFTPAIDRWAREGHVFRQAFTQYGGTHLSLPALWAARAVPRGWARVFKDINVFEPFINANGYDFVINDFTFEKSLRADTARTFLNPYIPSVQVDFCHNVASLEAHLDRRAADRPVFAFLAPMNLHVLNTRVGDVDNNAYPGFHAPYARQVQKVDTCFGEFIAFLKARGMYDNSIVVLASDHGDSLGEDGRWGHQSFLFPEIVRIPLIVRLPAADAAQFTTDLGRLTLLTDLAPSLLSVIGRRPQDYGPAGGSTFYVPADGRLRDRRRESALLMSSYGPTYGLLRRNGREMYVADLANLREYAFTIGAVSGRQVLLGDARRRVNQAGLIAHIDDVERLYRRD